MAPLAYVTDMSGKWKIVFISLWMRVICTGDGGVPHLSREDVLLLEGEEDPKCFTRTEYDFTCFFETPDNETYDIYYSETVYREKRCDVKVQRTEEGTFLHICSFPPTDVFMFIDTNLWVMEPSTNTTLYTRTVYVEDHVLLDPPVNLSLHHTDQAGQLLVTWHVHVEKNWKSNNLYYGIRYSSMSLGERIVQGEEYKPHKLDSLVPGEVGLVQMRVKRRSNRENTGHWSHWSPPVDAMVPQSADDISLTCYTSDLQNVTCQWDGKAYGESTYNLFYKTGPSEAGGWRERLADENSTDLFHFHGDKAGVVWVRLSTGSGPLNRTFYSEPFILNRSIKTSPPESLVQRKVQGGRLCLAWEAPLPVLSAHMVYQVHYQLRRDGAWMTVSLNGPETEMCLEVPAGSQYIIQMRARPQGSIYSGHWSDWSQGLTGDVPKDIGAFLIPCIPVVMLIIAVVFISLFPKYLSKLKQYLWPPVPNLDKVLQGFLTEINRQTWGLSPTETEAGKTFLIQEDPLFTAKQCYEETPASVVEIMSEEGEAPGFVKPHGEFTRLLCPERSSAGREQGEVSPGVGLEVYPDYVILNTDNVIPCQKGNEYVCEQGAGECRGLGVRDGVPQVTCHCTCPSGGSSSSFPLCSNTDILNHSYLFLSESADRLDCPDSSMVSFNPYVNLEGTAHTINCTESKAGRTGNLYADQEGTANSNSYK